MKMPKTQLKTLQTKLKSLQGQFNNICIFVDELDVNISANQLRIRLEKLDGLMEKISEILDAIELHEEYEDDDEIYSKQRISFDNQYYDTKATILDRLKQLEEPRLSSTAQSHDSLVPSVAERVRLPQIKLQTFDGNIDQWLSFRDLYTSLIHAKVDLPDVEKFHYLKGCLVGEARSLIDPLAITNDNYQIAWKTLMKRYNDSKLLKRRQVQGLFKLPSLAKESAPELQLLLEGFERIIQTLDQLVQPEDYKDLLLMEIVGSRLDPITRRAWEEVSATKEQDKVKDLIDFLQTRAKVLGSLPSKSTEVRAEINKPIKGKSTLARSSHNAVQTHNFRCIACPESHPLFQCPTFQRMSVSSRDKLLRSNALCRNCFRRGHLANGCPSTYVCRKCKGKHHTLVCFHAESGGSTKATSEQPSNSSTPSSNRTTDTTTFHMAIHRSSPVLLATAVVLVENVEGVSYPARALLDSGSECNFMAERLCQRLMIRRTRSNIDVVGIGKVNMKVKHRVEANIKSRVLGFSKKMEFVILPNVTSNILTTSSS